jgi:hypothetical protein
MRLGIIVRADKTGLGYQTRSYVKHLNPSKIIQIDISNINNNPQQQWYDTDMKIMGIPNDLQVRDMLEDIDVLLTAETPYNMNLYHIAKQMGVKTVCVENAEFYDHQVYPQFDMPDLIIMPSVWKLDEITQHANSRGTKVVQIHHPVDRQEITFVERTGHQVMHIAGKPAAHDRNGTWSFLEVCPNGLVMTQSDDLARHIRMRYSQSRVIDDVNDNNAMYQYGDILVYPRRYGGNSLVLNEALASGMPVIMTDISPNNNLLPSEWLVPANINGSFAPRTQVDIYNADAKALYNKIEWIKQQDIRQLSQQASAIADTISWDTLKPRYIEALESVL